MLSEKPLTKILDKMIGALPFSNFSSCKPRRQGKIVKQMRPCLIISLSLNVVIPQQKTIHHHDWVLKVHRTSMCYIIRNNSFETRIQIVCSWVCASSTIHTDDAAVYKKLVKWVSHTIQSCININSLTLSLK